MDTSKKVYGLKPLLVVKVGSNTKPATSEAITELEKDIKAAIAGDRILVTHHNVQFETVYVPDEIDVKAILADVDKIALGRDYGKAGQYEDDASNEDTEDTGSDNESLVDNIVRGFMAALTKEKPNG